MLVDIDDRVYHDFMEWSLANGMSEDDALKYINRAFRDKFMTDKYGDLNDKFEKTEPKPRQKTEPVQEPEPVPEQQAIATHDETMTGVVKKEPEPFEDSEPAEEKPKPKRKVLKSK